MLPKVKTSTNTSNKVKQELREFRIDHKLHFGSAINRDPKDRSNNIAGMRDAMINELQQQYGWKNKK